MEAEVNETSLQPATPPLFLSSRWGRQLPWDTQNDANFDYHNFVLRSLVARQARRLDDEMAMIGRCVEEGVRLARFDDENVARFQCHWLPVNLYRRCAAGHEVNFGHAAMIGGILYALIGVPHRDG